MAKITEDLINEIRNIQRKISSFTYNSNIMHRNFASNQGCGVTQVVLHTPQPLQFDNIEEANEFKDKVNSLIEEKCNRKVKELKLKLKKLGYSNKEYDDIIESSSPIEVEFNA